MRMRSGPLLLKLALCVLPLFSCAEALYPPRPQVVPGPPVADPPHSRVVMHLTLGHGGLTQLLDAAAPKEGGGTFTLLGERKYRFTRSPFDVRFERDRIAVKADVAGEAEIPGTTLRFSMTLQVDALPVISADYTAQLQSPVVTLTTEDRVLKAAEWGAGVLGKIRGLMEKELRDLRVDLRPMLDKTYQSLGKPLPFSVGDAKACATLGLASVEAGPSILSGGFEKDLAVVVAPSVTLPCTQESKPVSLPPLQNVAMVPSGPFELTVPVAAGYDELQKAMKQAFTDGKLFFSKEYPELYMENPEIYASDGAIVLKVHIDGFVKKGFKVRLSGDLFLHGHPQVRDNVLEVPDLKQTVETKNALLALKTRLDGEGIEKEARGALRLDISQRLSQVKARLSSELSYLQKEVVPKGPSACVRAELGRVEIAAVHAHESYLRLYVKASARAAAYIPCPP